jgi:hypothetical protein
MDFRTCSRCRKTKSTQVFFSKDKSACDLCYEAIQTKSNFSYCECGNMKTMKNKYCKQCKIDDE